MINQTKMGISKQLFMEAFEHQTEEEDRYLYYSRKADEMEWQEQLNRLNQPKLHIKIKTNGKFTKKAKKRIFKKLPKGYEKSPSTQNNGSVSREVTAVPG
jgi:hypothetical protein